MVAVDHVPWDVFRHHFMSAWKQGEHVATLAPTGQGKTTLMTALCKERAKRKDAEVVIFGAKPADETLAGIGWPILRSWQDREYGQDQLILWPEYGDPETATSRQRAVFRPVLRQLFMQGKRTIYIDEIKTFEQRLGFADLMEEFWMEARSNKITFMAGTQRPRWVGRGMFSEPSWLFLFQFYDRDDLRRIGEIGLDTQTIQQIVQELPDHTFLCIQRKTKQMLISKVAL